MSMPKRSSEASYKNATRQTSTGSSFQSSLFLDWLKDNLKQEVVINEKISDTTGFSNVQQLDSLQLLITDINRVNNRSAALVNNTLHSALVLQTNSRGCFNTFLLSRTSSHLQDNDHNEEQSQNGMNKPYNSHLRTYKMPLSVQPGIGSKDLTHETCQKPSVPM
jgi:hypothetical protein